MSNEVDLTGACVGQSNAGSPHNQRLGMLKANAPDCCHRRDHAAAAGQRASGEGTAEAFHKTLTSRLEGPGMRWDRPNAEGIMALAAVRSGGLRNRCRTDERRNAAQPPGKLVRPQACGFSFGEVVGQQYNQWFAAPNVGTE